MTGVNLEFDPSVGVWFWPGIYQWHLKGETRHLFIATEEIWIQEANVSSHTAGSGAERDPAITFGMIVLNNEPFSRFSIQQVLSVAHEVIVVEGSTPASRKLADQEGHSVDGTLETIRRLAERDSRIRLVQAEDEGHPDGMWPGEKTEMSQAYAKRATGDWLWQLDGDEFYSDENIRTVISWLKRPDAADAYSFHQKTYWGSPDYVVDGPFLRCDQEGGEYHRLFKWGQGYEYVEHRPPTVVDDSGVNLRLKKWEPAKSTFSKGVYIHHMSLLLPRQVRQKSRYYSNTGWIGREKDDEWALWSWERLERPFHVHNIADRVSWLKRRTDRLPESIAGLWDAEGIGEIRQMEDVEILLKSRRYRVLSLLFAALSAWERNERLGWRIRRLCDRMAAAFEKAWVDKRR